MPSKAKTPHLPTWKEVDDSINTLHAELNQINTVADTPGSRIEQLAMIFDRVKPLLMLLAALHIIPTPWQTALAELSAATQAITEEFKAGKDL
jgi:hypothetical protein